jgi:predicted DNA-binding protein with PD1-like motif
MKYRKIGADGEQTYALVFDRGDELAGQLLAFARKHRITAAHFEGLGALSDVVLGYYDHATRALRPIPLREPVEILSFHGDIVAEDDDTRVQAWVVVGRADGTTYGGHLMAAHVDPTMEVVFAQSPRHLRRRVDHETGLALIDS